MTTARNALRTTSIFRFRSFTNNLNFLNQSKHEMYKMTYDSKINLFDGKQELLSNRKFQV
jgi:hypothetical protein